MIDLKFPCIILLITIIFMVVPSSAMSQEIIEISAGPYHCLALDNNGNVWEWGGNWRGELGLSSDKPQCTPVRVPMSNVKAISAGYFHNLALKDDGTVWTWGNNVGGSLGSYSGNNTFDPVQVPLIDVKSIYAGKSWSFAVKSDGTIWAWGSNWRGTIGDGTYERRYDPVLVKLSDVSSIDGDGCFAVKQGEVWAWGDNVYRRQGDRIYYGTLGCNSTVETIPSPFKLEGLTNVTMIASGSSHRLILKEDGRVMAWGGNNVGQLGDGATDIDYKNTPVTTIIDNVKAISAGGDHSMALKNDGTVWTWGAIYHWGGTSTPQQVQGIDSIVEIRAGDEHCMALKSDGTVWTWGCNDFGQLGNGKISAEGVISYTPTKVNIEFDYPETIVSPSPVASSIVSPVIDSVIPTEHTIADIKTNDTETALQYTGFELRMIGLIGLIFILAGAFYIIKK